jgi:hypothetical protein
MKFLISLTLILSTSVTLLCQGIYIDNNTKYKDGVYSSYEDFINNEPSLPFAAFDIKWIETPYFNKLKIKSCKNYQDGKLKKTEMRNIWGFCLGGTPYINYSITMPYQIRFGNQAADVSGKSSFSRIRILGNICHFNIEDHTPKSNSRFANSLMNNDVHGRMVRVQKMIKLSTGKIYDYDEYVLSQLMKDDEQLVAAYKQEENREAKMFSYLKKYNERNPILNKTVLATIK